MLPKASSGDEDSIANTHRVILQSRKTIHISNVVKFLSVKSCEVLDE